jgi:hypothetical protein
MAKNHLSIGNGFSQRIPASVLQQQNEEMIFLKEDKDSKCKNRTNEKKPPARKGIKRNKSRESTGSDNSSNGTRHSSATSNTGYRTSMEEIAVQHMTRDLSLRDMYPESSFGTSRIPPDVQTDQFETAELSASTAEVQRRPLSPRSEMNTFRIENPVPSPPARNPPGPLERFFSQGGGLPQLGSDRVDDMKRLLSLRSEALRLRSKVRTKRKELHLKQEAKDSADDAFMRYVREHRTRPSIIPVLDPRLVTDPILDQHYESMEAARGAYGPSEYEYNALEDVLDETEFELARTEGRLYHTRGHGALEEEHPSPNKLQRLSESPFLGLSSEIPREYHSLQVSYLSRLGDLDLARERYHSLNKEQEYLLSIQESRSRLGIELHDDEKTFLEGFSERKATLEGEIVEIEEDVKRWKEKCSTEGIDIGESTEGSEDGDSI